MKDRFLMSKDVKMIVLALNKSTTVQQVQSQPLLCVSVNQENIEVRKENVYLVIQIAYLALVLQKNNVLFVQNLQF